MDGQVRTFVLPLFRRYLIELRTGEDGFRTTVSHHYDLGVISVRADKTTGGGAVGVRVPSDDFNHGLPPGNHRCGSPRSDGYKLSS